MTLSIGDARSSLSAEEALGRLVDELTAKLQAGEAIDVEAAVGQHPEHAEQLRRLLPALDMLADFGASRDGSEAFTPAATTDSGLAQGTLGDFRIVREIGRGGMGIVYEAEQISLQRRVALKVLPFAGALDQKQLQRFRNEAQAAAQLHHTNIVPVFYVGCERGVHFYAMQYIEGQSLAEVIAGLRQAALGDRPEDAEATAAFATAGETASSHGQPTVRSGWPAADSRKPNAEFFRTVAHLGIQAGQGLEHAHQLGVIHRDIKPANLLVDTAGTLWITDFGLARLLGETGLTLTGDLLGTLRYKSRAWPSAATADGLPPRPAAWSIR